ncbi:hypothetical protein GOC77_05025 [Haloarcula argentinensis]|uniref:Uncharacterized protein n=1 Tax=Haloarcula argentinensis TaxID=43776 RepID=A0A847ULI1_HALAR|nr:hypothetical protein [Haloarcula argentinensis]NLV12640.1 hypothetical protein [Haloarcula argentinensis]
MSLFRAVIWYPAGSPVDVAIDEGWATVAVSLKFSKPAVSRMIDGIQRFIANADDRPADEVARADAIPDCPATQRRNGDWGGSRFECERVSTRWMSSETSG